MKVNVLRIDDNFVDVTYEMDYKKLIHDNDLYLEKEDGTIFEYIKIKNIYQDEFNNLRITLADDCKYIITLNCPIDLNKDLKTQQIKDILSKLNEKYVVFIETKDNSFLLSYIDDDSFETRLYSKDNESLEDFILRIGNAIVNNK